MSEAQKKLAYRTLAFLITKFQTWLPAGNRNAEVKTHLFEIFLNYSENLQQYWLYSPPQAMRRFFVEAYPTSNK